MNRPPIILYLHIPKAGGTTLSNWIFDQVARTPQTVEEDGWLNSGVFYYPSGYVRGPYASDLSRIARVLQREDLLAVLGHFEFGIHCSLSAPARYVTMLRDPVERVVSLYHFQRLVQRKHRAHQGVVIPKDMTLEQFVAEPPYKEVDNGQVRRVAGLDPAIGHCDRTTLETALGNLEHFFSVVGLVERFDETLILISRMLGWAQSPVYYSKNQNPGRPTLETLPQGTVEAIRESNWLDCQLYAFVKKRFEETLARQDDSFANELASFQRRLLGDESPALST
jgi:hypothetical protein